MTKFVYLLLLAFTVSSCMKEPSDVGGGQSNANAIPADFDWKTTRDVKATVAAPVVDGASTPAYAVIRIFSAPVLSSEHLVAMGVATASTPFSAAFTMPAAEKNIYVQTTLPDGTKSVRMVAAQATVNVPGAAIKSRPVSKARFAAATRVASSMPSYPTMTEKTEADFESKAVIREILAGKDYQLGSKWCFYAAAEYLIPSGVEISASIDLNGGFPPYDSPILYVAGTYKTTSMNIGRAQLVILPGGKVEISRDLSAQNINDQEQPAIYLFEGATLTVTSVNMSNRTLVNGGVFKVNEEFDANNSLTIYNTASAKIVADDLVLSNDVTIYNDGEVECDDFEMNSKSTFTNCENGHFLADDCGLHNKAVFYQKGMMNAESLWSQADFYVNCYTVIDELEGDQGNFYIASGAALETESAELKNSLVELGDSSYFITEEYNIDDKGGHNNFTAVAGIENPAVVIIKEKAYSKQGHDTNFAGLLELVYDNTVDKKYQINERYLSDGAVMSAKQTVVIPETVCNGGRKPIEPEPEPDPDEYILPSRAALIPTVSKTTGPIWVTMI